jgi:hypothetical protein
MTPLQTRLVAKSFYKEQFHEMAGDFLIIEAVTTCRKNAGLCLS